MSHLIDKFVVDTLKKSNFSLFVLKLCSHYELKEEEEENKIYSGTNYSLVQILECISWSVAGFI
jgi:hypothetical protein